MPTSNPYREQLQALLKRGRPRLAGQHRLEFKNCFGAIAGYIDGKIFISCGHFGVALRLPPDALAELFTEDDVLPLKYFARGHVKKEYAVIPARLIDDREHFKKLLNKSLRHASSTAR